MIMAKCQYQKKILTYNNNIHSYLKHMWLKLSILVGKFGNIPSKRLLKPNNIRETGAQKTNNILNGASTEADPRLK